MKKIAYTYFLIVVVIFLKCNCCIAQSRDVIAYLHPLEVKNKTVTDVLEIIDSEIEECIFVKHGFPYCYGIDATLLNSGIVHVSFYSIQNYFIDSPYTGYGYFYYKDKIVLVEETSSRCELYEKWFQRKEETDTLHFVRPTTKVFFTPKSCIGIEQVSHMYQYNNDSLVLIHSRHCTQMEQYYHKISYADTSWEEIANLYMIPLDSLKNKNRQGLLKKTPKEGKVVRIY